MTDEQSRKSDSRASFSTAERRGAGGDQSDLQGFGSDMVGLGRVESPAAPPQATAPSPAGKGRDRTETQVSALNDPVARIDRAARLRESAAGRVGHLALAFRPQKASAADDRTGRDWPVAPIARASARARADLPAAPFASLSISRSQGVLLGSQEYRSLFPKASPQHLGPSPRATRGLPDTPIMCGIFAVLGLTGDPALNRQRVYRLAKRIRHRGPDSYNMDVRVDEAAGTQTFMVHKRLSIVAPGPDGDQPVHRRDPRHHLHLQRRDLQPRGTPREVRHQVRQQVRLPGHRPPLRAERPRVYPRARRHVRVCH